MKCLESSKRLNQNGSSLKMFTIMESEKFEVVYGLIIIVKNSPHRRDRIWIVANSESNRSKCKQKRKGVSRNEYHKSLGNKLKDSFDYVAPTFGIKKELRLHPNYGRDDGISNSLDRSRNKALEMQLCRKWFFYSIINL